MKNDFNIDSTIFDRPISDLEDAFNQDPSNLSVLEALTIKHFNDNNYRKAEDFGILAMDSGSCNPLILQQLIKIFTDNNRTDQVGQFIGQHLKALDRMHRENKSALSLVPKQFKKDQNAPFVIGYKFWGRNRSAFILAEKTLQSVRFLMPNWSVKVFIDSSVPDKYKDCFLSLGADVITMPPQSKPKEADTWPLTLLTDPNIRGFMIRDILLPMNASDLVVINEWLQSDKAGFAVRDTIYMANLLPSRFWGLKDVQFEDIAALKGEPEKLQANLDKEIWPLIHDNAMVFDRFSHMKKSLPTPNLVQPTMPVIGLYRDTIKLGQQYQSNDGLEIHQIPKREKIIFSLATNSHQASFLATLLKTSGAKAEIYGNRNQKDQMGHISASPEIMALYAQNPNDPDVKKYWLGRMAAISQGDMPIYADTSNIHWLSGLMENIPSDLSFHFIVPELSHQDLTRVFLRYQTMSQAHWEHNFFPSPIFGRNIVFSEKLMKYGEIGRCFWLAAELNTRQQVFLRLLDERENCQIHRFDFSQALNKENREKLLDNLELNTNARPNRQMVNHLPNLNFGEKQERLLSQLFKRTKFNAEQMALRYIQILKKNS